MGMAYAYKKGELDAKEASQEVKDLADSMTLKQLKKYAATKHEGLPDKVDDNLQPGDVGGMGPIKFPTATETGSGDVPAGQGDAEEEYKKKRRKMKHLKNFEQFINESQFADDSTSNQDAKLRLKERTELTKKLIKATGITTWEVYYGHGFFIMNTKTKGNTGTEIFGIKDLDYSFTWRILNSDDYEPLAPKEMQIVAQPTDGSGGRTKRNWYVTKGNVATIDDVIKAMSNLEVGKSGWKQA